MIGVGLEPSEEIAYEHGYIWKVSEEEEAKKSLLDIKESIIEFALPLFYSMSNKIILMDFIYPIILVDSYKHE